MSRTEKVVYQKLEEKDKELKESDTAPMLGEVVKITSGLPVFEASLVDRNCIMERIKRALIGLFNTEANRDFALAATCFPVPWYAGSKEPNEFSQKVGENIILFLGVGGQFGYAVPDNTAYDAYAKRAQEKLDNLNTLINSEFKSTAGKDQHAASGVVKQEEKMPAAVAAESTARKLVASTLEAVNYIIRTRKDENSVTCHFEGMNNFSPLAISDKIAAVMQYKQIPGAAPTALKVAQRDLDHAMTPGATPEESAAIDSENAEMEAPVPGATSGALSSGQSGAAASSGATSKATTTPPGGSTAKTSNAGAPDRGPDIKIPAKAGKIDPARVQPQHDTDKSFVATMKKKIGAEGYDPTKGALVVEIPGMHGDGGSIYKSLDAHHRIDASVQLGLKSIPAYIIAYRDWQKLTDAFPFDPKKLASLDSHIELPDGRTYDQVRTSNSHTNNSVVNSAVSTSPNGGS